MGALTPIIYQGAIPVFADVDPHTYNVTAETIAAIAKKITRRTKAVIGHAFIRQSLRYDHDHGAGEQA